MDFEILEILPIPVIRSAAPFQEGEEIFEMPRWHCFCCHDTGWVQPHIASLVIADYNPSRHRTPVCQACDKGRLWFHLKGNIDMRFNFRICKRLDKWERDNWKKTVMLQLENFQKRK